LATLDFLGGTVQYLAGPGESNQLSMTVAGPDLFVVDPAATITLTPDAVAAGCTGGGTGMVRCDSTPVNAFDISTGDQNDLVNLQAVFQSATVFAGDGDDTVRGGSGLNQAFGEGGADLMQGGAGPDSVDGGPGNDTLLGDAGRDTLQGGNGEDRLNGGPGDDVLDGGNDLDTLVEMSDAHFTLTDPQLFALMGGPSETDGLANFERAELTGGPSDNTIDASLFSGSVSLDGQFGNDTLIGTAFDDRLDGGSNDDVLNAGDGNDELLDGDGNDNLDGGPGNDMFRLLAMGSDNTSDPSGDDVLDFFGAGSGVVVDLDLTGVAQNITATATLQITGQIENFLGTGFADQVFVDALADPRKIDGAGGPMIAPGDVMAIDLQGRDVLLTAGTVTAVGLANVLYPDIETIDLLNTSGRFQVVDGGTDNLLLVRASTATDGTLLPLGGPTIRFTAAVSVGYFGGDGDDILRIENPATQLFAPAGGIFYDGGGQPGDTLELAGGGGSGATELYSVGPGDGDGSILTALGPDAQNITFTGLAPVIDSVPVDLLTVTATDAANLIRIDDGPLTNDGRGQVAIDVFEPLQFENKAAVQVDAGQSTGDGDDVIAVDLSERPLGLSSLVINGGSGDDTVTVVRTPTGVVTQVLGLGGANSTFVGEVAGGLAGILGDVSVTGGSPGLDALTVDDRAGNVPHTFTVTNGMVERTGGPRIDYSLLDALTLQTGTAPDSVNLLSSDAATLIDTGAGDDTITISSDAPMQTGDLDGLAGPLTIEAGSGMNVLKVSDRGESSGGDNANVVVTATQLLGIAGPGDATAIGYRATGGAFANIVLTGSGAAIAESFAIQSPAGPFQLVTSAGPANVLVQSLSAFASIVTGGDDDVVTVSSQPLLTSGDLNAIAADLDIDTFGGNNRLIVSDANDAKLNANANVTLAGGDIVNLAGPTDGQRIRYAATGGSYTSVDVLGSNSTATETYSITNPAAPLSLDAAAGDDVLHVFGITQPTVLDPGAGNDTINVSSDGPGQAGDLDGIANLLTLRFADGNKTLNVSDQAETTAAANANVLVGANLIQGIAGPNNDQLIQYNLFASVTLALNLRGSNAASLAESYVVAGPAAVLNLLAGDGADAIRVDSLGSVATIDGGAGDDSFSLGRARMGGAELDPIAATLDARGGTGNDSLLADDTGDLTTDVGALTASMLTGLSPAAIGYTGFESLTLLLGGAADQLTVTGTHAGSTTIQAGDGDDMLAISGSGGAIQADGTGGNDRITLPANLMSSGPILLLAETIDTSATVSTTVAGSAITLGGAVVQLGADVRSVGGPIAINGAVLLGAPALVTLSSTEASAAGAAITFSSSVGDDASPTQLHLLAGTGDVSLAGSLSAAALTVASADDVTLQAVSTTGSIAVAASNALTLAGFVGSTASGTIDLAANQDGAGTEGLMQGSTISTANDTAAAVTLLVNTAAGGTGVARIRIIQVGGTPGPSGGRITIDAHQGAIADDDAGLLNLSGGNAVLLAGAGIGTSSDPIETALARLEAAGGSGGVFVTNPNTVLSLGGVAATVGVSATSAAVSVTSGLALNVDADVQAAGAVTLAAGDDTMSLGDDLVIASGVTVQSTGSGVSLAAGDNLVLMPGSAVTAATTATLSTAGDSDGSATISLAGALTATAATLQGGVGTDTFRISSSGGLGAGTVDNLRASLNVVGGGGSTNQLEFDDSGDASADQLTITSAAIGAGTGDTFFLPGISVAYSGLSLILVNLGSDAVAANRVVVQELSAALGVGGGGGRDLVDASMLAAGSMLFAQGGGGDDTLTGGAGADVLHGGDGRDQLGDGAGDDQLDGGPGDDRFLLAAAGNDAIFDAAGNDTLDVSMLAGGVRVDLDLLGSAQAFNGPNTLTLGGTVENFVGGSGDDDVTANPLPVPRSISGGPNAGLGDIWHVDAAGAAITLATARVSVAGLADVSFDTIETIDTAGTTGQLGVTGDAAVNGVTLTATSSTAGSIQLDAGPIVQFAAVGSLAVSGGDGDDRLRIVNPSGSLFAPVGGISFDGGGQPGDTLVLAGGGGSGFTETYTVGPGNGDGTIQFAGPAGVTIGFTGLAPVMDTVTADSLVIRGDDAANVVVVDDGTTSGDGLARVAIDAFEPIEFANKTTVTIETGLSAGDRDDTVVINQAEAASGLTTLIVNALEGGDLLDIRATVAATVINGGAGNDSFVVSSLANRLDAILGALSLRGDAGTDSLLIRDRGNAAGFTFRVDDTSVQRALAAPVGYLTMESLMLLTGAGADTIDVTATAAGTPVTVDAGSGDDTIHVSSDGGLLNGDLDGIRSPLDLRGSVGTKLLAIGDRGESTAGANANVLVDSTAILNFAGANDDQTISYTFPGARLSLRIEGSDSAGVAELYTVTNPSAMLTLLAHGGADGVRVHGLADVATVDGGAGDDTFALGMPGAGGADLEPIAMPLTVDGNAGTDSLVIDDTGDATGDVAILEANLLTNLNPAAIRYLTLESLTVFLGSGADQLSIDATHLGSTAIAAGDGDDRLLLSGSSGSVTGNGGSGADRIDISGSHAASLNGGAGDDLFLFADGASVTGFLSGDGGNDTVAYSAYTTPVSVDFGAAAATGTSSVAGIENATGGVAGDTITGDAAANTLRGGGGSDTITGGGGNDSLDGGAGDDTYEFSDGWGSDLLVEPAGGGSDTIRFSAATANLTFALGSITVSDGAGNALTYGDSDVEQLVGGSGNDRFAFSNGAVLAGGAGTIDGGAGSDSLDYSAYTTALTVNLATATATGTASVSNVENVTGGSASDTLTGDATANHLAGGDGDDTLTGDTGGDTLDGGAGSDLVAETRDADFTVTDISLDIGLEATDRLVAVERVNLAGGTSANRVDARAFTGAATLRGAAGNDTLLGGPGNDSFRGGPDDDLIDLGLGTNFDVQGGPGIDTVSGSGTDADESLSIVLLAGTDLERAELFGNGGNDALSIAAPAGVAVLIDGGPGDDSLNARGAGSSATLMGLAGNDTLVGGMGDDLLNGGDDADSLDGATGQDTMNGGLGDDRFLLGEPTRELVQDAGGQDLLDFRLATTAIAIDLRIDDGTPQLTEAGRPDSTVALLGMFETVLGSPFADAMVGNAAANLLDGGAGNDTIEGAAGDDLLQGGPDDDTYRFAGAGLGSDQLGDAAGTADSLDFTAFGSAGLQVDLRGPTIAMAGMDLTLTEPAASDGLPPEGSAIERVVGSGFADTFLVPLGGTPRTVDGGGQPAAGPAGGDQLIADAAGAAIEVVLDDTSAGMLLVGAGTADVVGVSYAGIETISVQNPAVRGLSYRLANTRTTDGQADTIALQVASLVDLRLNGRLLFQQAADDLNRIAVDGTSDSETLLLAFGAGPFDLPGVLPGGIQFDGASGPGDELTVRGGGFVFDGSYQPSGTTSGAGLLSFDELFVSFAGLEPITVEDMSSFVLITPKGADVITVDSPEPGATRVAGTSGGVPFEAVTFRNVGEFTLDAASSETNASATAGLADEIVFLRGALDSVAPGKLGARNGSGSDRWGSARVHAGPSPDFAVQTGRGDDRVSFELPIANVPQSVGLDLGAGNDLILLGGGRAADVVTLQPTFIDVQSNGGAETTIIFADPLFAPTTETVAVQFDGPADRLVLGAGVRVAARLTGGQFELNGTFSADTVTVGDGTVQISSPQGTSVLQIGSGVTLGRILTGDGADSVRIDGTAVPLEVDAGAGSDFVSANPARVAGRRRAVRQAGGISPIPLAAMQFAGGAGNDTLVGGSGNDVLSGGTGADELEGSGGNDSLDGGPDGDTVAYMTAPAAVTVDLPTRTARGHGTDVLAAIEHVLGSPFADVLVGDSFDNLLRGAGGNDFVTGRGGNDTLDGGAGNDNLSGNGGDDLLLGAAGNDRLRGNDGNDQLDGGDGDDRLTGHEGDDTLIGQAGNDSLLGCSGDDLLEGDAGNDTLCGGEGDDILSAGSGSDFLFGAEGHNQLFGDSGFDMILATMLDTIDPGPDGAQVFMA
jgi:Ca2+-binding RTX toxin-like protein